MMDVLDDCLRGKWEEKKLKRHSISGRDRKDQSDNKK